MRRKSLMLTQNNSILVFLRDMLGGEHLRLGGVMYVVQGAPSLGGGGGQVGVPDSFACRGAPMPLGL